MEQDSLFSTPDTSGQVKTLTFFPSFEAWRNEARMPLQRGIEPHACEWLADKSLKNGSQDGWQDGSQDDNRDTRYAKRRETAGKMSCVKIPSEFVQLGRAAACHRNPDRWALLYSVAWRILHRQPHLLDLASDPEVVKLHRYAKAVARDAHKMKAFVRFRSVSASGELGAKEPSDTELVVKEPCCKKEEPRYVAWFEPEHFIVEFVSGFFQRRFTNMAWSILTPYGCVHWEGVAGGECWFSPATDKAVGPQDDQFEDYWRVYYKSIFNPARLKISAMQSEMAQKYWKNLPEASVITELVQEAGHATSAMIERQKTHDTLQCGPRPQSPVASAAVMAETSGATGLAAMALQARSCTQCQLCEAATQTVFGEGPVNARLVIVGEQPGDQEDLAGRPFVGPAGELLNAALKAAGIDREEVYVTNAVKHFKFTPRGKRRIHSKPNADELRACFPWLQAELREIRPQVIVGLGASAAFTLLGSKRPLGALRGAVIESQQIHGGLSQVLITHHPAHALRSHGDAKQSQAYINMVADLTRASGLL